MQLLGNAKPARNKLKDIRDLTEQEVIDELNEYSLSPNLDNLMLKYQIYLERDRGLWVIKSKFCDAYYLSDDTDNAIRYLVLEIERKKRGL